MDWEGIGFELDWYNSMSFTQLCYNYTELCNRKRKMAYLSAVIVFDIMVQIPKTVEAVTDY